MRRPIGALLLLLLGCSDYTVCEEPPTEQLLAAPSRLSETGVEKAAAYEVRFALYSDGASKQRSIWLPPGTEIDRSDPDDWVFPVGTRLFKMFSIEGRAIETRMLERTGPGDDDWLMVAYVFDAEGVDATLAVDGAQNAVGTSHDVPAARDCRGCHGGRRSRVLGYSAVQLGEVVTFGNEVDRAALGYLHANCSHCHNQARSPAGSARCYNPQNALDFRLLVSSDTVVGTPAYRTAVVQTGVLRAGHPESSEAIELMRGRLPASEQMPPLGTEVADEEGVALVERWVRSLAP